jgi:hypothetical protein
MKRVVLNLSVAALLGLGALAIQSANFTRSPDTVYASDNQGDDSSGLRANEGGHRALGCERAHTSAPRQHNPNG